MTTVVTVQARYALSGGIAFMSKPGVILPQD